MVRKPSPFSGAAFARPAMTGGMPLVNFGGDLGLAPVAAGMGDVAGAALGSVLATPGALSAMQGQQGAAALANLSAFAAGMQTPSPAKAGPGMAAAPVAPNPAAQGDADIDAEIRKMFGQGG